MRGLKVPESIKWTVRNIVPHLPWHMDTEESIVVTRERGTLVVVDFEKPFWYSTLTDQSNSLADESVINLAHVLQMPLDRLVVMAGHVVHKPPVFGKGPKISSEGEAVDISDPEWVRRFSMVSIGDTGGLVDLKNAALTET